MLRPADASRTGAWGRGVARLAAPRHTPNLSMSMDNQAAGPMDGSDVGHL